MDQSSFFKDYAQEFSSLLPNVETQEDISKCSDLLQLMVVEARCSDLREHKDQYNVYKSQFQAMVVTRDSRELMTNATADSPADDEKTWTKQNNTLTQASNSLQQTEEIALSITSQLLDDNETLRRAKQNAEETKCLSAHAHTIATNLLKPWWRKGL